MNEITEIQRRNWSRSLFSVVWEARTYLNILYLLTSMPLGVLYFTLLITGFALGLGLAIVWIGLPILLLVVLAVYALTGFERLLAIHVLGQRIDKLRDVLPQESAWQWLKGVLTAPATWKGLVFLLAKFPFGIVSFCFAVTLLATSVAFLVAPILVLGGGVIDLGFWEVDSLPEALLCTLAGAVGHLVVLHLLNALAWVWGALARGLLGKSHLKPPDSMGRTRGGEYESAIGSGGVRAGDLV